MALFNKTKTTLESTAEVVPSLIDQLKIKATNLDFDAQDSIESAEAAETRAVQLRSNAAKQREQADAVDQARSILEAAGVTSL